MGQVGCKDRLGENTRPVGSKIPKHRVRCVNTGEVITPVWDWTMNGWMIAEACVTGEIKARNDGEEGGISVRKGEKQSSEIWRGAEWICAQSRKFQMRKQ